MTLKPIALLFLTGALAASALPAQETATPLREAQVERRANRQQARIAQGAASGQLTARETRNLEKHEAKLDRDIGKAEADGKVTPREQARLNREEDRDSRKIFRKKHNRRVAGM